MSLATPRASWVTPAARVLLLVLLTSAVATLRAPNSTALLLSVALLATLMLALRPDPLTLLRRALVGLGIVLVFVLPLLLTGQAAQALLLGARSTLALGVALTLAQTLALAEVGPALAALGVPAKLASVVAVALTQVGLLRESGERIVLARRLRGARGAHFGPDVVATLLVHSAERAERMALAAELRGHDLGRAAARCRLRPSDALAIVPALAFAVVLHLAR